MEQSSALPESLCRVLPPESAQEVHEKLRSFPDHDQVECYCCCKDCPGWTEDLRELLSRGVKKVKPGHDPRSTKYQFQEYTFTSYLGGCWMVSQQIDALWYEAKLRHMIDSNLGTVRVHPEDDGLRFIVTLKGESEDEARKAWEVLFYDLF